MVVVHESPPNQVLIIFYVFVKTGELYNLHDDEGRQQCYDQQCRIYATLHQDLSNKNKMCFLLVVQQ